MEIRKVAFIGAGNMSRSIISGLVKSGYDASQIIATNPSQPKLDILRQQFGIQITNDNSVACAEADVIVLAVKPQLMEQVCQPLAALDLSGKLIISIAAGINCARFGEYLKQPVTLVRTMPNTPSMLGLGLTGLYADSNVDGSDRNFASQLMAAVGQIVWLEHESGINDVIACAGSSPAYFFLFMEAMAQAAINRGVSEADARLMIQQAAIGSAAMVEANPDLSLAQLRAQVTSKGGATHEAIQIFEQHDLRTSVDEAMNAAIVRAEQMEQQF